MTFTVISFYTNDWEYPKYAERLKADCRRLNLDYVIEEVESTNSYVGNCNLKPEFIRKKLLELKRPVFWVDIDGSINQYPVLLDGIISADIAGNKASNSERIHVGSIWFNYSDASIEFLNEWCERTKNFIDDGAFNAALSIISPVLEILPPEYFKVISWPNSPIPVDSVIVHRLSNSSLKHEYKNQK